MKSGFSENEAANGSTTVSGATRRGSRTACTPVKRLVSALSCTLLGVCGTVNSQVLEEVMVTATKRVESIQDVPVSVVAVGEEQFSDYALVDLKDLTAFVPNFEYSDSTLLTNLYMRGLGSGNAHAIEQSIGRFVDDLYVGRSAINLGGLFDVQSVEVLRGPQGTLFGRNTIAGAMIVNTARPTDSLEANVTLQAGAYSSVGNHYQLSGHVSGPLSDSVRGRLAVRYRDADGWVENRMDGPDSSDREEIILRGWLDFDFSERTSVKLKLEYSDFELDGQTTSEVYAIANPALADSYRDASPGFTEALDWTSDISCAYAELNFFCPGREQTTETALLVIEHEFESAVFSSITGYQSYEYDDRFEPASVGIYPSWAAFRAEEFESVSQEFKLVSNRDGKLDYVVGVYLESNELGRDEDNNANLPSIPVPVAPIPPVNLFTGWDQETETAAIFGEVGYQFTDSLRGIFGARYNYESKDFFFLRGVDQFFSRENVLYTRDASRSEDQVTPAFTLQWDANDELMLYYSISEGHKTGGFRDRTNSPDDELEFDAETALVNEFGLKGTLMEGRMRLNLAVFHMAYEDLQVAAQVPNSADFDVVNAAEATSQGVEFDWTFALTDSVTFGGSLAYLDATYDSFPNATCNAVQLRGELEGCEANADGLLVQDLSGEVLPFAPEYSGNVYLRGSWDQAIGQWSLVTLLNVGFSDGFYTDQDLDPEVFQDSFSTVDASITLTSPTGSTELSLIGRNLTEEEIFTAAFDTAGIPSKFSALRPPRDLMLRLSYNF